jgi:hypothetical protein
MIDIPSHFFFSVGATEIAEYFVRTNMSTLNITTREGATPLFTAVAGGMPTRQLKSQLSTNPTTNRLNVQAILRQP